MSFLTAAPLLAIVTVLTVSVGVYFIRKLNEPKPKLYNLSHGALNVNFNRPSLWMNMGYWPLATEPSTPAQPYHFTQACAQLFYKLLRFSDIVRQEPPHLALGCKYRFLDVGVGCGDQTQALVRIFRGKIASYTGITNAEEQAQCALERVKEVEHYGDIVQILTADAAKPDSWKHRIVEAVNGLGFRTESWLIALDCAYHFSPSREPLLHYALHERRANFAAFDLMLSPNITAWQSFVLRALCPFLGTPYSNLLTVEDYVNMLVRIGYPRDGINVEDVTPRVFPGLVDFLERQDTQLKKHGLSGLNGSLRAAKWLFTWWRNNDIVRAYFIVARHGKDSDGKI